MNTTIPVKFEHHPEPEFQLPIQNHQICSVLSNLEHRNIMSRRLHIFGSSVGACLLSRAIVKSSAKVSGLWAYCLPCQCMGRSLLL